MKKEEMRKKINEELGHIPRSYRGSKQNLLRFYYNVMRMTDLGRNPLSPAKETLIKAIEAIRKDNPDFSASYDRGFFDI